MNLVPDGFVIMQIGDPDLDQVYETAIGPAIEDGGLVPKRIDIDNAGGLLKSEIVEYIERSDVIVADLTNERPNCYLEVGYAMGLGRYRHLILTVRADHVPGNVGYVPGGPKVHFDLAGYDLLMWSPEDLAGFRNSLARRVERRLAITRPALVAPPAAPNADWTNDLSERGRGEIQRLVGPGYMELAFGLEPPKIQRSPQELLAAARQSTITTFGWPIGVSLDGDDDRPRPTGDGIRAEVSGHRFGGERSFDLWELRSDGDFFLIQSLFEDQRGRPAELFFNTRIVRVTEAVLFSARLYERLEVPPDAVVRMRVAHGGLNGRMLTSSTPGRHLSLDYKSIVDRSEAEVAFVLGDVAGELLPIVKTLLAPMFELFDFFQLGDPVYEEIVDSFVGGKIS